MDISLQIVVEVIGHRIICLFHCIFYRVRGCELDLFGSGWGLMSGSSNPFSGTFGVPTEGEFPSIPRKNAPRFFSVIYLCTRMYFQPKERTAMEG